MIHVNEGSQSHAGQRTQPIAVPVLYRRQYLRSALRVCYMYSSGLGLVYRYRYTSVYR